MIIGIYGRIGAGKSLAAKRIVDFHPEYKILDLDLIAGDLLNNNEKLIDDLRNNPTATKAIENDKLNKKEMTKLIFNRWKTNEEVSHIIWPYVATEVKKQLKGQKNVIIEASTLPALGISNIDTYLYIKRRETPIRLFKTAKQKNKHWWQILTVSRIQKKYNRKFIKKSTVLNNLY